MNETNKQSPNNDENHADTNANLDNASFDLRAAAAEAVRLTQIAAGEAVSSETNLEPRTETKTSAEVKTENITAIAPETKTEGSTENTTNDLQQEAFKAMKLEAERRREEEERAKAADSAKSIFSKGTRLKLQVTESGEVMMRDVVGDLVVGRADNVTDYIPEIDLTPYGAYRLGLSRRHAIILLEGERLVVKDLNSRNGTFVNGVIVPSGGTQTLRDGDELRFGNLGLRLGFERA